MAQPVVVTQVKAGFSQGDNTLCSPNILFFWIGQRLIVA